MKMERQNRSSKDVIVETGNGNMAVAQDHLSLLESLSVLRRVQKETDGVLGLNSFVVTPGRIALGDRVELIPRS